MKVKIIYETEMNIGDPKPGVEHAFVNHLTILDGLVAKAKREQNTIAVDCINRLRYRFAELNNQVMLSSALMAMGTTVSIDDLSKVYLVEDLEILEALYREKSQVWGDMPDDRTTDQIMVWMLDGQPFLYQHDILGDGDIVPDGGTLFFIVK